MYNKIKIISGLPKVMPSVPTTEYEWRKLYKPVMPKYFFLIKNESVKTYFIENKDCILCLDEINNYCFFYHFKHKETFIIHDTYLTELI